MQQKLTLRVVRELEVFRSEVSIGETTEAINEIVSLPLAVVCPIVELVGVSAFVSLRHGVSRDAFLPTAAVNFDTHANRPAMVTVRMKTNFGRQHDGVEAILDGQVSVGVSVQDFFAFATAKLDPLVETRTEVLEHVVFGELGALAVAEASLRLGRRYDVDAAQIDLKPFFAVLSNHFFGTPSAAVLIHVQPVLIVDLNNIGRKRRQKMFDHFLLGFCLPLTMTNDFNLERPS